MATTVRFVIGAREFATGEQRYTQGGKLVRTDLVVVDSRLLFKWRLVAVNRIGVEEYVP